MNHHFQRILTGLAIGFATGILYGLVSAHINHILYPNFQLDYQLGRALLSMLEAGLVVGLLGGIASATPSSYQGVLAASILGALSVVAAGIIGGSEQDIIANLLLMVYGFLPLAALFLPLSALLRWADNRLIDSSETSAWTWRRLRGSVILLGLALLVGTFSAYPREAQVSLARMQRLITNAQQTNGQETTPYLFANVAPIVKNASPYYTLEWSDDISKFPMGSGREGLTTLPMAYNMVTARFASGEVIACLFSSDGAVQLCAPIR